MVRVKQDTDDNILRRIRFPCSMPKATDTGSEYIILADFLFSTAKMFTRRASMLRYTHIAQLSR